MYHNMKKNKKLPVWDLSDFYKSHESEKFQQDLQNIEKESKFFNSKFKGKLDKLSKKDLIKSLQKFESLEESIGSIRSYIYLLYCTNQLDDKIVAFYQKTKEILSKIDSYLIFYTLEINRLKIKSIKFFNNSKYESWISNLRKFKIYQQNEKIEKILLDKNITSSAAWIRLFDQTMAGMKFKFKKKEVTESEIINYLSSKNSEERKEAAISFGDGLKKNINLFSIITNTLSKDLEIDRNLRGFKFSESFRHLDNQVDKKDIDCLTQTVVENYKNLSHRYYKFKAKSFGVKKLNYWDRNAPYPDQKDVRIPWEEAKDIVTKAYKNFDTRISNIVEMFFKNSWIHAQICRGKASGAFSHPTVPSVHPYILVNYQNKLRDVTTLAHELGHGVHQVLASHNGLLVSDTPLTLAETASVFGEMLTFKFIFENLKTPQEKKMMLTSKIEDMLNTVVRQISFFIFEKMIHEKRKNGELTVNDINECWLKTQTESLGKHIHLGQNYEYFWSYIPHFIHSPFYVYAYAFGDCLVNSLYSKYEEGFEGFNEKYIELLSSGGSKGYKVLLNQFDLNPEKKDFWQGGLNIISDMIDNVERLN
tara:strand:- start:3200 stop:4969 length:1770 start_codon:yes stop_codon:yes gene_type:complete